MRYWNWVERLHGAMDAAAARPFDYGTENCGLFAAQCIDAIVEGSQREAELRSQFTSTAGALAFLEREGGIIAAVQARLGPGTDWWHARRGDVCMMPTQDGPGIGVCMGDQVAMMSLQGLTHAKLDLALKVWRID